MADTKKAQPASPYSSILVVATETSDVQPAVERAAALARRGPVRVSVLDVAEPIAEDVRRWVPETVLAALETKADDPRRAKLARLEHEARATGIAIDTELARGSVDRLAIGAVLRQGYELVVKSVESASERSRATLGSADKRLLRNCPCPVWLVAPDAAAGGPVLAAVNPDPADPEENLLSEQVLQAAAAVAMLEDRELHVLHAWKVLGERLAAGPAPLVSDPEVDHIMGAALTRHAGFVDDLLARTALPIRAQAHVVHARAADAIIDFVATRAPSLLVMGTVGRTGVPGLLIGNTAERVLSEVTCSLLALKPQGFVSPVTAAG